MLVFILVLSVLAFVTFICLQAKIKPCNYTTNTHDLYVFLSWIFGFVILGLIIAICCLFGKVAAETCLDDKIEMYQEENSIIEQDIDRIVSAYLEHEQGTFEALKTEESSITLITLFPELKSDTLVLQQLEIYVNNNAKIKRLKEEKIDISQIKWILYFGK